MSPKHRHLYLVRHAKSSWKYPGLDDFDRPLNDRGDQDVPEMTRRLQHRKISPDYVISSPANRALTTARRMCNQIGFPEMRIVLTRRLYHASPKAILEVIHGIPADREAAFLFGHNPGITEIANILSGGQIENIPTTGIACIRFDRKWSEVDAGTGKLKLFDFPKNPPPY